MNTHIPDSAITLIREMVTLVPLVEQHTKLERTEHGTMFGKCPLCNTQGLFVAPERNTYRCHACGEGGDIIHFVQKVRQSTWREAIAWLYEQVGLTVPEVPAPVIEPVSLR